MGGHGRRMHGRHVHQGGFDRRRCEVVELAEAPERSCIQANHYLSGWPSVRLQFGLLDLQAQAIEDNQVVDGHPLVGVVVLGIPMNGRALTGAFP
jgi:hypothetical protein